MDLNTTLSNDTKTIIKHLFHSAKGIAIALIIVQILKYLFKYTFKLLQLIQPLIIISLLLTFMLFIHGELTHEPTISNFINAIKQFKNL
jgi:hypothetical protein